MRAASTRHTGTAASAQALPAWRALRRVPRALALAAALAAAAPAFANEALATRHGCLGCHAKATKLVGPSYADIAAKYGAQAGADKELAARIRSGGSGRWGDLAMPPQGQLSEAEALRLAQWILSAPK